MARMLCLTPATACPATAVQTLSPAFGKCVLPQDAWLPEEDEKLRGLYAQHGTSWSRISKALRGRTSQQCRARWHQLTGYSRKSKPRGGGPGGHNRAGGGRGGSGSGDDDWDEDGEDGGSTGDGGAAVRVAVGTGFVGCGVFGGVNECMAAHSPCLH